MKHGTGYDIWGNDNSRGVSLFKIDRDLLGGPNMTERELIEKAKELYNKQNPDDKAISMMIM